MLEAGLQHLWRALRGQLRIQLRRDGAGPDSRFQQIMRLVAEHGAAVVALTIDEEGQARTATHKVAIADASSTTSPATGAWPMLMSRYTTATALPLATQLVMIS